MYKSLSALLLPILFSHINGLAQTDFVNYQFKKGEIMDIILLSQKPNTDSDLKSYFQAAIPIAKKMSYQPLPGFKINDHSAGNLKPNSLLIGKWASLEYRSRFLNEIEETVPDFHERRRKIWSYFGLTYYQMKNDLSFEIDKNNYNVATALWCENVTSKAELKKWLGSLKKSGGKLIVKLEDGISPFGYHYQPEVFYITSWKNKSSFEKFKKENNHLPYNNVIHINQFIL